MNYVEYNKMLMDILSDPSSLTKRFKALSKISFVVEVLREGYNTVSEAIYQKLAIPLGEAFWLREIHMKIDGEIFLHAKTYIPQRTIEKDSQLLDLKSKPLGELLFQDPNLQRNAFEWSDVVYLDNYLNAITRSSIFYYYGCPLLVVESFTEKALTKLFERVQTSFPPCNLVR